jgi:DNA-binding Lrp family transcriptional regulator
VSPDPVLPVGVDALDARLLLALGQNPRAGVMELARTLGVARGTVQARLDKLRASGVVTGFDPDLDLAALGYHVTGFVDLQIAQGHLAEVVAHLEAIPEVLEAHTTTGPGDLQCRVVAHTNQHLQAVLTRLVECRGVERVATHVALTEQIRMRTLPLLEQLLSES